MKKKIIMLSVLLTAFLAAGLTTQAAPPWIIPKCGICGEGVEYSSHLSDGHVQHTVQYSEDGQLKTETCYINYSEDRISVQCPNGHGTIWEGVHHTERHTCSRCISLDYYEK